MKDFKIHISDEAIEDLHSRLDRTRWPDEVNDDNWTYGARLDYVRELCRYWRHDFDWRAQEAKLNAFDHFTTDIDAQRLHFIHQRSPHADARPMIVTHGWPGSIVEFMDLIPMLTEPEKHGGDAADAFHVVCPSLPGFGFSAAPTEPGMEPKRIAALQIKLMAELGYEGYIAQGGDWGSMVSTEMARQDPERCAGLHLNMLVAMPPGGAADNISDEELAKLSPQEAYQMQNSQAFAKEGMGYYHIQSTKPQTLSYALTDSPAGQAAWLIEKFRDWSDCDGDVEKSYSKDQLLTNISIYWFTATAGSSARLYYETVHSEPSFARVEVPTGSILYPKELVKSPRSWAEAAYNVVHWSEKDKGGHFAAMEEPASLAEDLRLFNRRLKEL